MPEDDFALVAVRIRLEKRVDSFYDLLSVAAGMLDVDMLTALHLALPPRRIRRALPDEYWLYPHLLEEMFFLGEHAQIRSLQIASPPDFSLYCRPEWLSVYISLLAFGWGAVATYDAFERNLQLIRSRIAEQIERIAHAPDRLKRVLLSRANRFLDHLLELPERELMLVLRRIQEARRRLAISTEELSSTLITIEDEMKPDRENSESE